MKVSPTSIRTILFICTGNTCRSPMAAGLLKKLFMKKHVDAMQVGSAGLVALPGNPASFNAIRVAQENSVDLKKHKARLVTQELIESADLILVMEPQHRQQLLHRYPEASAKTLLFRHFARYGSRERGINDPYGLNLEAYRFCFADIKECVESLHQWLVEARQS
jgi:protein-tyrosine-phosphatase